MRRPSPINGAVRHPDRRVALHDLVVQRRSHIVQQQIGVKNDTCRSPAPRDGTWHLAQPIQRTARPLRWTSSWRLNRKGAPRPTCPSAAGRAANVLPPVHTSAPTAEYQRNRHPGDRAIAVRRPCFEQRRGAAYPGPRQSSPSETDRDRPPGLFRLDRGRAAWWSS